MSPNIITLRTIIRAMLAMTLTLALLAIVLFLVEELSDADPNAALTALLGSIVTGLSTALGMIVKAIAETTGDQGNGSN